MSTWGELVLQELALIGAPLWTVEDHNRVFRGIISGVDCGLEEEMVTFHLSNTEGWNPGKQAWFSLDETLDGPSSIQAPIATTEPTKGELGQLIFSVPYMGEGVVFLPRVPRPTSAEDFVDNYLY